MTAAEYEYEGDELTLFQNAKNWKRYWSSQVRPYLGKRVLEVGAGLGSNTAYLNGGAEEWVCLEPDKEMSAALADRQRANELPATRVISGTIADLPARPSFDSIVYIDVLEHIGDDASEIAAAAARLFPNGTLVALSPAHQWLFSPFDAAIGHCRRYSPASLRALTCPELELVVLRQLDSVGILASAVNRFLLRPKMPTVSQILAWDRFMVPVSRLMDPLLFYSLGKSIVAVWRRR